jgi:glycosyltransferase involved in cell wall biosynthesis
MLKWVLVGFSLRMYRSAQKGINHDGSCGNRIRIAFSVRTTVRAGVEEHVLSILNSLDSTKYESFLLADPTLIRAFGDDLTETQTKVVPIRIQGRFDYRAAAEFLKFAKEIRPHILHSHMFIAGFFYSPLARVAGIPVVLETVHGIERHRVEKKLTGRLTFLVDRIWSVFTDAYIGVSHSCAVELREIKGIPSRKIFVVHNGRDLTTYKPPERTVREKARKEMGIKDDDFVFGVIGRLDYQKGHTYLLKAASKLLALGREFKVLFVGDGPYEDRLKAEADRLGLNGRLIWAGFRQDVTRMLAAMDVNVLPSLYEGLPLVAIESLATCTPMIATRVDGNPEVVLDGKTGIICREKDPEDLSHSMAWAQDNLTDMQIMASAGRKYVLKEYSLKKQMAETEAIYKGILSRKSCR